jgi:uncharacterized protein YecT (DUF1311 family)
MKTKFIAALIASTTFALISNVANAGCENPRPGYDEVYCMAKLFMESDNELNKAYRDLGSLLTTDQKKTLKSRQVQWIKYREKKCFQESNRGGIISVSCNFQVNKSRTKFLLDRITECKIGACKSSEINRSDFGSQ